MKQKTRSENGQALLLIAFAMAGLYGLVALALDGGMAYSNRRQSQNAADGAALFAARIYAESLTATTGGTLAQVRDHTKINGFVHDGVNTTVDLVVNPAPLKCPDKENGLTFTVTIHSTVQTSFAPVIGITQVKNITSATALGCKSHLAPPFYGNAVVALNPDPNTNSFDAWGNSSWTIYGGGAFSNANALGKGTNVNFPDGQCVTSVLNAQGFPCPPNQNDPDVKINYPTAVTELQPPNPCVPGGVGIQNFPPSPGKGGTATFTNGVYCIGNLDSYSGVNIVLDNATLYITDPTFELKFAGKGGFSGSAINKGDFTGYFLFVPLRTPACPTFTSVNSQVIEFRGNGLGDIKGTVWAPSACIDFRGNSNGYATDSQIVGYNVTTNGNANVVVNYNADDSRKNPVLPTLQLLR